MQQKEYKWGRGQANSFYRHFTKKTNILDLSQTLNPILRPGRDGGDLGDRRAETVVTGLRSEVGAGAATISRIRLVRGSGTRIPRMRRR